MIMETLKPCPRCDRVDLTIKHLNCFRLDFPDYPPDKVVICNSCGLYGPICRDNGLTIDVGVRGAVSKWNEFVEMFLKGPL